MVQKYSHSKRHKILVYFTTISRHPTGSFAHVIHRDIAVALCLSADLRHNVTFTIIHDFYHLLAHNASQLRVTP